MRILHTESSPGWGGQELRILREAEGMRARGHTVFLAVQEKGGLVEPARAAGFEVLELPFRKGKALSVLFRLLRLIVKEKIDCVNTHSSLDAWIGGLAARLLRRRVIRTRHLSTPIRAGLNSRLLYNTFADCVVTTCSAVVPLIQKQAKLSSERCFSIPTGVDPTQMSVDPKRAAAFRQEFGIEPDECLVGTLCVLRGWKGIADLLQAAKRLEEVPKLKWVIVGSGVSDAYFKQEWERLGLQKSVFFAGHRAPPYEALAAMDIFALLSWANEGVSQASLQAAWLGKPLITTTVGGLGEVCLDRKTGLNVAPRSPEEVAKAVRYLMERPDLRARYGERAHQLVADKFLLTQTLDQMERAYVQLR